MCLPWPTMLLNGFFVPSQGCTGGRRGRRPWPQQGRHGPRPPQKVQEILPQHAGLCQEPGQQRVLGCRRKSPLVVQSASKEIQPKLVRWQHGGPRRAKRSKKTATSPACNQQLPAKCLIGSTPCIMMEMKWAIALVSPGTICRF